MGAAHDRSALLKLAQERFGVAQFRAGQLALIEAVLRGEDTIGILPTGAGKSLTYQLPALLLEGAVVVVSPLISLMQDQHDKLEELAISAARLNSTLSAAEEREAAETLRAGGYRLIYVTPERLQKAEWLELLKARTVGLFVVDEAHCVSQWGHDFRPAYLALRSAARELGNPPVLALTATATGEMIEDIRQQLDVPHAGVVHTGIERKNLNLSVVRTPRVEQKREFLADFVQRAPGLGIIYTTTVRSAVELQQWLNGQGIAAGVYHGRLGSKEREETQRRFMADEYAVMVATSAFGLGIDKPDIRFVVHFNFPDSLESYYQEAGRAGRDGELARAILLYRLEDKRLHSYFLAGKYPERAESLRIVEGLAELGGGVQDAKWVAIAALAGKADVHVKRAQVVVAQLEAAGIVVRRRERMRLLRGFSDGEELDQVLSAYEARRGSDRARLEAVMHYAQSPACRSQQLRSYFGEGAIEPCGRCDNCEQAREAAKPRRGARKRLAAPGATDKARVREQAEALEKLVASAVGNVPVSDVVPLDAGR